MPGVRSFGRAAPELSVGDCLATARQWIGAQGTSKDNQMNPLDLPSSLSMKRLRLSIDNTVYVVDFTFSSTDWRLTSSHIGFSITQSVRAWFPLILQMRCPPFCTIYTLILHWLCILSAMTIVLSRSIFCCSLDAASISFSHDRIHLALFVFSVSAHLLFWRGPF